ncbi:MAG TPA: integrase arm-type DNA-binding domain-containing protein, partial [Xanthobacteraceae bacterium]|nr:integrase arm-type DNA-binding domain-containing protein [Xanthobacteraceae bacterium]
MKFTAKTIGEVRLPAGKKDHIEWDDELPGFGVRLREGGSRNFVFQYALGDKQRRMSLGTVTTESFKAGKDKNHISIRERVAQLQARVKIGQDPAGEKAESREHAAETFLAVGKLWLAKKTGKDKVRPGTYRHLERHILQYSKKLHGLKLASLSCRTVGAEIEAVGKNSGPVAANRMQATLSEFFTWSMTEGCIAQNPLVGRDTFEEKPRERVLSDAELKLIWDHAGDDHYGSIIRLLALLGQRADEVASLQWSEVADDMIVLPSTRTKNGLLRSA